MNLHEYTQELVESEKAFEGAVEKYGVAFEVTESSPRSERKDVSERCNCSCENGGSSIWRNWISPACLQCRTGENTGSLFVDLRCTKRCYFCFNANQPHFDHFCNHQRDIVLELEQAHALGASYSCLAITGGEPLLHKDSVVSFFRRATELYPLAHKRLYTNGELLNEQILVELAESGLTEIRFSVKPPDVDSGQGHVFSMMEQAVALFPAVVIEIPIIPGSLGEMKGLIRHANSIGVRGINLLEFCFPLCNAEEFSSRGFLLRKQPYRFLYDYWYSGGVPVACSESEALDLVEFAAQENLAIGIHYCSADNRNSGQINLQNKIFEGSADLQQTYPWMKRDEDDFFLKCVKVFGDDALIVRAWAESASILYHYNESIPSLAFSHTYVSKAQEVCPAVTFAESINILEEQADNTFCMREVGMRELPRSADLCFMNE